MLTFKMGVLSGKQEEECNEPCVPYVKKKIKITAKNAKGLAKTAMRSLRTLRNLSVPCGKKKDRITAKNAIELAKNAKKYV